MSSKTETLIDRFTKGFFWFGFLVFLGASIPHIASYYRHFDPNATPWSFEDIRDWTIGYLIAIVIDVTDVLVSIAVMNEMKRGTRKRDLWGYWTFIVFVMALSWFLNWQYNIVYGSTVFAKADNQQIFNITIGTINPIIGSAFQLLILAYTAMAHKFSASPVKKTAEQLKQEADELEQVALQQARIDAVRKTQGDAKVGNLFDTLNTVKKQAKELFAKQVVEPQQVEDTMNSEEPEQEPEQEQPEEISSRVPLLSELLFSGQGRNQLPETSEEQPAIRIEQSKQILWVGNTKYFSVPYATKQWKLKESVLRKGIKDKEKFLLDAGYLRIEGKIPTPYVLATTEAKKAITQKMASVPTRRATPATTTTRTTQPLSLTREPNEASRVV